MSTTSLHAIGPVLQVFIFFSRYSRVVGRFKTTLIMGSVLNLSKQDSRDHLKSFAVLSDCGVDNLKIMVQL